MKLNHKILLVVLVVISIMIWNSLSQKGVGDLPGDFKEVAAYRNENNTGPIQRIYVVSVRDTLWQEMQAYGDFQLHTKFGNTQVFFFLNNGPVPETVSGNEPYFASSLNQFCVGRYEKNASGLVRLDRYPF